MPVNYVHQSIELVLHEFNNPTPSMGVAILDIETARANGIPEKLLAGGLVVLGVYPDTPAAVVGLQGCRKRGYSIILGDQITAIEGHQISTYEELKGLLSQFRAGDTIMLDVLRGEQKLQVPLTLEARPRKVLM